MENKAISIIGFNIRRVSEGILFISRNSGESEGEGTEVDEKKFSEHVKVFYDENF